MTSASSYCYKVLNITHISFFTFAVAGRKKKKKPFYFCIAHSNKNLELCGLLGGFMMNWYLFSIVL